MDNAIFKFPNPGNEPVKAYAPGTSEKIALKAALTQLSAEEWDTTQIGRASCRERV